jgi:hypothetical protein
MLNSDKFREECGVVAIYAHPEAEKLAYLGLHALQHRGQESAGIVSSDGMTLHAHKAMGLVADIFVEDVLAKLRGTLAIGHTRYSTAGDSALLNAQPILVQSNKGSIAVAHNGNLVNAQEIRSRLEAQGSIFQTTSDTEVIVHLIAMSREHTLPEAMADALRRVEGAFSLVMVSADRVFAARDPRGFRPLAMGRIPAQEGVRKAFLLPHRTAVELHFRARLLFAARQPGVWPVGTGEPGEPGTAARPRSAGRGGCGCAGTRLGRHRGRRLCSGERDSLSLRAHPQSLRGTHLHRTQADGAGLRRSLEAESGTFVAGRQSRGADR